MKRIAQFRLQIGSWLGGLFPQGTLVACEIAGQIPYASRLPMIDTLGLNDVKVGHLYNRGLIAEAVESILSREPSAYLFLFVRDYPETARDETRLRYLTGADGILRADERFWRNYELAKVFRVDIIGAKEFQEIWLVLFTKGKGFSAPISESNLAKAIVAFANNPENVIYYSFFPY